MATAKPIASTSPVRRGRPWLRALCLLLAVAAAGLVAWYWRPISSHAVTGAAYGARVACSCRFVAKRPLSSCRDDFKPGMQLVMLAEDAEAKNVTARFPLLASQTATYREGAGCLLEPWDPS